MKWLARSNEHTNYTYHLTDLNVRSLAHFISGALDADHIEVRKYVDEILNDSALSEHISSRTLASERRFEADPEARYGRRIGWYAMVRILKPKVVVETGTDKGLGSCALAAALLRNERDGFPGELYTIDADPASGWLLGQPYSRAIKVIVDDSHAALSEFDLPIDVFIHDSFHDYIHESQEYILIRDKLTDKSVALSDNAHAGSALMDFAESQGFDFYFWGERPDGHFYPGGGIGLAVRQKSRIG